MSIIMRPINRTELLAIYGAGDFSYPELAGVVAGGAVTGAMAGTLVGGLGAGPGAIAGGTIAGAGYVTGHLVEGFFGGSNSVLSGASSSVNSGS